MSVDVAGYVRLTQRDEEGTHARLMACRSGVIELKIADAGGRVVKGTGDGVLAEFPSALAAVFCAVEIQRAISASFGSAQLTERLDLRIGIAAGDILVEPDDIYGETVNLAVRLQGEAEPGGICVSQAVRDQTSCKPGLQLELIGARALKHLAQPIPAWRVRVAESPTSSVTTCASLWDVPAVAVLPLRTPDGTAEDGWLADGFAEDLIAALGSWGWFPVIAGQSSFCYRDSGLPAQQVARELGAGYLVTGTFRREWRRIRITARLIEGGAGRQCWAGDAVRPLDGFFDGESEMLLEIACALEAELARRESEIAAAARQPSSIDAYLLLQRGLWHLQKRTAAHTAQGRRLFGEAINLAPDYSLAWAALARATAYAAENDRDKVSRNLGYAEAGKLAETAVQLEPTSAASWYSRGEVWLIEERRWDDSLAAFEQATIRNPSHVAARGRASIPLACTGQHEAAVEAAEFSLRLSPRDPRAYLWWQGLGVARCLMGQHEQALAAIRKVLLLRPNWVPALHELTTNLSHLGRRREAAEAYRTLLRLEPDAMERAEDFAATLSNRVTGEYVLEGMRKAAKWAAEQAGPGLARKEPSPSSGCVPPPSNDSATSFGLASITNVGQHGSNAPEH